MKGKVPLKGVRCGYLAAAESCTIAVLPVRMTFDRRRTGGGKSSEAFERSSSLSLRSSPKNIYSLAVEHIDLSQVTLAEQEKCICEKKGNYREKAK